MRWIIRHNPSGEFVCSTKVSVYCCEFARKFNSVRQARIFLRKSCFPKEECSVIEYSRDKEGAPGLRSDREIEEHIRYNFFG